LSRQALDKQSREIERTHHLAYSLAGFHAFWVDAERYADGEQRFDGLQPEPVLPSELLPRIGELDWTGAPRSSAAAGQGSGGDAARL